MTQLFLFSYLFYTPYLRFEMCNINKLYCYYYYLIFLVAVLVLVLEVPVDELPYITSHRLFSLFAVLLVVLVL